MASSNGSKFGVQKDVEQQVENEQKQQLLQQQNYLQQPSQHIDVRMKRHPELQPYVPSDRDRVLAGNGRRPGGSVSNPNGANGGSGGPSMNRTNLNHRLAVNKTNKGPNNTNAITTTINTNDAKTAKSKKCVSMTRLDQLAQPKKIFPRNTTQQPTTSSVPSTSLSSSNATSTTTSSLTSNKNYHQLPKTAIQSNRLSTSRQSKPATPKEISTTITLKSGSSPKREATRRPSIEMIQRKSLESRSSFVSTTDEETVRLKINGDLSARQENDHYDADEFIVNEVNETRTNYEDHQEESRNIRQDEDSRIMNEAEEYRLKQEKERRLRDEEEARMRADEEARLKADEELREKARLDEEERQKRQLLVESILSRFTPSS